MNRYFVFITFLLITQIAVSQKTVVGLHNINSIYAGIKNPIDIAMDGYTLDKLKTTTEGCALFTDSLTKQFYLTANTKEICKVYLSFKKSNKIKLDTLIFNVRQIPPPESMHGELQPGYNWIRDLISQHEVNVIIPNFYIDGYEYKVLKFDALFVPKRGLILLFSSIKDKLPMDLKFRIMAGKNGDMVIIDNIITERSDGKKGRMEPIVNTIHSYYEESNLASYDFQNIEPLSDRLQKNNFNNDPWNIYEPGITKGYLKSGTDSQLVFELKKNGNKIFNEKHFYPSGKLKAEYVFEDDDTLGEAISYYENGKIKSRGKILPKLKNIYNYYRIDLSYGHCYMDYDQMHFLDSFFLINYVPYGHWLCYSENGNILMDCNLALFNHGKMPMSINDSIFDLSNFNPNWEKASLKSALLNQDCYFKVGFDSLFRTYNQRGQPTEVKYYNYKREVPNPCELHSYLGDITYDKCFEYYEYYANGKLLSESRSENEKIYKTYYQNGKVNLETFFNKDDIIGEAKSYYENGKVKAEGRIIKRVFPDPTFTNRDSIRFLDTIKAIDYEKLGTWKVYHPNGQLALECNYTIFGWPDLPQQLRYNEDLKKGYSYTKSFDEEKYITKEYSKDDILKNNHNKFYSKLSGPCKIYNEKGDLIKLIDFKP